MTVLIEGAIALDEVAKIAKMTTAELEDEARALNLFVGHDWAGRPALSEVDAAAIVSGSARREQEHAIQTRAHQDATDAWQAAKERARAEAATDAPLAALQSGYSNSAADERGREAAWAAIRKFELEHPVPRINGQATVRTFAEEEAHSARTTTTSSGSWLSRAAERIGVV